MEKEELIERLIKDGAISFREGLILMDKAVNIEPAQAYPVLYPNPDYGKPWWGIFPPAPYLYPGSTGTTTDLKITAQPAGNAKVYLRTNTYGN